MKNKEIDILNGDIIKGLIQLAIPLMVLNLMNTLYNIVDTFFVGKIGELQVGAVSLIGPIMQCGNAFSMGLSCAAIALIARAIGAKNRDLANKTATTILYISIVLGILIGVISFVFANPILKWFGTPQEIYKDSYLYLIGISFDFLFMFILNIFQAIRQSDGDSKTGVKINAYASLLNVIFDPLFIFVLNLGVFGAALATTLSKACMVPVALKILTKKEEDKVHISLKDGMQFDLLGKILGVAIPSSLGSFLSSFGFVLMNKSIVSYGAIVLSAYGLGNKISSIFYIPVNGIGGALSTYIAQNLGAKNIERTKLCFKKAMQLSFSLSFVLTIIGFGLIKYAILLFISHPSPELYALSSEYAAYSIATMCLMGWFNNLSGVFNGASHTKLTLILSTTRLWGLRIPMIYCFSHFTNFGPTGIWWSMCLSNLVICIVGQLVYNKEKWLEAA